MNRLIKSIQLIVETLFGRWSWQPPSWFSKATRISSESRVAHFLRGQWERLQAYAKAHPKPFRQRLILAGVLVVGFGLGMERAYHWYSTRPIPAYVHVRIEPPSPIDPEVQKKVNPLIISFSASAAIIDRLSLPISSGIQLTPPVKGSWQWLSDRTLSFQPSSDGPDGEWKVGQKYKLKIEPGLLAPHVLLKTRQFEFETEKMILNADKQDFYIDPRDPNIKKVVIALRFNYPVDLDSLKKRITFQLGTNSKSLLGQAKKNYPFTVSLNKTGLQAYLHSETVPVPDEDSTMTVKIEKGVSSSKGGAGTDSDFQTSILVPGKFDAFKMTSAQIIFARNEKFEPEQVLVLTTSIDAKSEDLAKALKLQLLPIYHPTREEPKKDPYLWRSASEVEESFSKDLVSLQAQVIPTENEMSKTHSFKIVADPMRFLLLSLPKGVPAIGGYELSKEYKEVVSIPEFPKELAIMSHGALLSLSGDKKLSLLARNVSDIEFEVGRILPEHVNHLISQSFSGGSFQKPNLYWYQADTLAERFLVDKKITPSHRGSTEYFSFDFAPYLNRGGGRKGMFFIDVHEKKTGEASDRRFILVTDLGVIVKTTAQGTHEVFVQNLQTGLPVAGAQVEVIGRNGLVVIERTTGGDGLVSVPDLKDFEREKQPIAFVVKKESDYSFLPFGMDSRQLSFSRFDVGGAYENPSSEQLSAFVFSDRGLYRPGEEVRLGLMARSKNWKKTFKNVPLIWSVTDSRGVEISREQISVGTSEMKALAFTTLETSPTGQYEVRVFVTREKEADQLIGSLTLRVEEFLPDRLRILTTLSKTKLEGWITPQDVQALVSLKNLFGTPAENRVVRGHLTLHPTSPTFEKLKDFQFLDLNKKNQMQFEESLGEQKTSAEGEARFDLDLNRYDASIYSLRFSGEGFEVEGGRGVTASVASLVSPLSFMVGWKADGDLSYLKKDSERSLTFIAVDPSLTKIAQKDLKMVLVERKYVSSLLEQSDGTYRYQSVLKETLGDAKPFVISEKGTVFKLPTSQPGDFAILIKNKDDREISRTQFSVAGEANLTRSLEKNAELQVALNKKDFKGGEEIELQIKAPYTGAGLITIERDRVYTHKWFKTSKTSTIEHIRLPESVEGNAYVNVTFLRALDSKEIFMSPLSYSATPISVSLDSRVVKINLQTPEVVKPGQTLKVKYSADKKTEIVVYGVDEGILLVSRYKLPNPLGFFFQRRALQVQTYQLLDLLLPEFSIVQSMSAPGGDEGFGALGKNLNPFKRKGAKPVVFWSGVLTADAKEREYSYAVPESFNGNIKVMAVAANEFSMGSAEKNAIVKGDFILTPSVPSFVTPGDEFEVGVGVSNQLAGSGKSAKVLVEMTSSEHLDVLGEKSKEILIDEGRESETKFRVKANDKLGSGRISLKAISGSRSAALSTELSVRPASPHRVTISSGVLKSLPLSLDTSRKLYSEFRRQEFYLSPIPMVFGYGLMQFLEDVSYGCTEQTISKSVPAIALKNHPDFSINAERAEKSFKSALATLRTRQTSDGGFAMYVPSEGASPVASVYAAMFLTLARERGYAVPEDMFKRSLEYLKSSELKKVDRLADMRVFAKSIYVLARNGVVPTADISFLRKYLDQNYKGKWSKDLIAAYLAGTYKLLKQDNEALKLARDLTLGEKVKSDYDYFYDTLAQDAQVVQILARHFPELTTEKLNPAALESLVEPIVAGQFNTFSMAQTLFAFDALLQNSGKGLDLQGLKVAIQKHSGELTQLPAPSGILAKWILEPGVKNVRVEGETKATLFYSLYQSGFETKLPTEELRKNIEVSRELFDKANAPLKSIKLGDEVSVHLRVRSLEKATFRNLVMVDLLPGGFELVLPSRNEQGGDENINNDTPDAESFGDAEGEEGATHDVFRWLWSKAYAQAQLLLPQLAPDYVDYREDRVVIYFTSTKDVQEFVYKMKAVNAGKFTTAPSFAESMYDRGIQFVGRAGEIRIESAK